MTAGRDITDTGRAVTIRAAMRQGEAEFHDLKTPADSLMAQENGAGEDDRSEALTTIMAYLFSATPHPAHVMHRLYVLTRETAPAMLRTLPAVELHGLLHTGSAQHLWRVAAILRGTRYARRPAARHNRIVNRTLAAAFHWQRAKQELNSLSLEKMLANRPDEPLQDYERRMDAVAGVLRFFFFDGPQPECTVLRVFAMAKALYPELIHEMTVRQLGDIFGVVGATWSERIKQKVNRFLEERGAVGVKARFQKSDEACAAYSAAQKGNHNRRGGEPTDLVEARTQRRRGGEALDARTA